MNSISPDLVDQVMARLAGERQHVLERLHRLLRSQAAGHDLALQLAAALLAAPRARLAGRGAAGEPAGLQPAAAVASSAPPRELRHARGERKVRAAREYNLDSVNAELALVARIRMS